jgi:hypothetical protein
MDNRISLPKISVRFYAEKEEYFNDFTYFIDNYAKKNFVRYNESTLHYSSNRFTETVFQCEMYDLSRTFPKIVFYYEIDNVGILYVNNISVRLEDQNELPIDSEMPDDIEIVTI